MSRFLRLLFVFVFVAGLFAFGAPRSANAKLIEPPSNPIAPGSWDSGTQVDVDLVANPAPAWLQLLTYGVKITEPGQVCHEFRGGQYYWIGEIRMLQNGKWVAVETTNGWVPSVEGKYMSCAHVTTSGVYALFGYYHGPIEVPEPEPEMEPT